MRKMVNQLCIAYTVVAVAAVWFGCAAGSVFAEEVFVHVAHDHLDPDELAVTVGDTVSFHNHAHDHPAHVIAAEDGSFRSPPLEGGDYWSYQFTKPGTYTYGVASHKGLKGTVVVK